MKKKILSLILILSLVFGGCAGWAESAPAGLDLDELFSKRDRKADYDADNAVTVALDGNTASCESDAVSVEGGTVTITEEGIYVLSGELNGMIVVNADKKAKVQLVLDGVSITSETSAALYVIQADKVFLTLAEGSENTLANGGEFVAIDENDIDAAIFSKEDLTLNGAGSLAVLSPAGHGIVSKDDLIVTGGAYAIEAAGHGLSGNDSVRILTGSFAITAGKDGIHSENSDDAEKGFVAIAGGEFTIAAEGDGISASGTLQIDDGDFTLVTGSGSANGEAHAGGFGGGFGAQNARGGQRGRGGFGGQMSGGQMPATPDSQVSDSDVSRKALKAEGNLTLNGGRFSIDAADDAIHCGSDLTVSGGSFDIATGDDGLHADANLIVNDCAMTITESYEGLEGQTITVNGGDIILTASDDGLNAAGGNDGSGFGGRDDMFGGNSDCSVVINGGALTIDAQGDGLDSNGALTVNGGTIYVSGPTNNGNGALDCGTSAVVNGGTVIAAGASGMAVTFGGDSTQGSIMVNVGSQQAGAAVTLTDESGRTLASWTPEKNYQNVVVSCEGMVKGGVYTLTAGSYSQQITLDTISYGASSGMGGWGGRRW